MDSDFILDGIESVAQRRARCPILARGYASIAEIGLEAGPFAEDLNSQQIRHRLEQDLAEAASVGGGGFPTLVLAVAGRGHRITEGYMTAEAVRSRIETALA